MIAVLPDTFDSCVSSILLQNIAYRFKKHLSLHFCNSNEFGIYSKQLSKYYLEPHETKFVWIINQDLNIDTAMQLAVLINEYPYSKFIYLGYINDSKQNNILLELNKNKNFKYILCTESICDSIYKFGIEKEYIPISEKFDTFVTLSNNIISLNAMNNMMDTMGSYDHQYRLNLMYTEFGFYHFKENFVSGINEKTLQLSESILKRKKSNIEYLFKNGSIQKDENIILATTEDCMLNDLIYFSLYKKSIINLVQATEIYVYTGMLCNIKEFFNIIQIDKFFKSEIYKIEIVGNFGKIYIKDKIKFESAIGILKYIFNELKDMSE